jgi:hypothetical protein
MARLSRLRRLSLRVLVALGGFLLVAGIFFSQTPWGKEMVLREVLKRARGMYEGELTVEGISSPGLLRGFTLKGVRLTGEDGRPFLVADSVMAGVSPRGLMAGDFFFTRVHFWSPQVIMERLPGRERMNVSEIFRPRRDMEEGSPEESVTAQEGMEAPVPSAGDSTSVSVADSLPPEGRTVTFVGAQIHDGTLEILLPLREPLPAGSRALVALDPEGNPSLRRYAFSGIDLDLSKATVLTPLEEGESFAVANLAFTGQIFDAPFQVSGTRGTVRRTRGLLRATIEALALPASQAEGSLEVEWGRPNGVRVEVHGNTPAMALEDLHWIEKRLPEGVARGPFGFVMDRAGFLLDFRDTRLALPVGGVRGTGGLLLGAELGLRGLDLELDGVELELLDPWLARPLPLKGLATGELNLSGSPAALAIDGDLTLLRPDSTGQTEALFSGIFHLGDSLGVSDLIATLAPLEWSTFASISPGMTLRGPGALRVEANGYLAEGIFLDAEATHVPGGLSPSRVTANGTVSHTGEEFAFDLSGELAPLSFTTLREDFPDLPLTGEVAGPVSLSGPYSALTVRSDLTTSAGPLNFTAEFDARNPLGMYRVDVDVQEFLLSGLVPDLPDPTRLTGRILASGSGIDLDSLEVDATIFLRRGEVGALRVDTAAVVARVQNGLLTVDALRAETSAGTIEGGGAFGVSTDSPAGELTLRLDSESLEGIRPFLMGEIPVVFEELSPMERDWLVLGGADLDTIPRAAEVALEGAVRGQAILRGGLRDFSGEGSLTFQGLRYRREFMESGSLTFSAQGLPGPEGRVQGTLRSDSLFLSGQGFQGGEAEVDLGRSDGRVRLVLSREGNEEYRGRGTFSLDSLSSGHVNLDEVLIRFDTVRWNLGGPSSISWSPLGIEVRDFRLIRPGVGGMRVQADGFLPFEGEGDFALDVTNFHLDRLARITQISTPLEGVLNLEVQRTGTAQDPRMEGSLSGSGLRWGDLSIGGVSSDFHYQGRTLLGVLTAQEGGQEALSITGRFPLDLRFQREDPLIPEAPVDLSISVDSFPAALALAVVESIEDVRGTITGEMSLGGTPRKLEPSGDLQLEGGSVRIPALGIRYREAEADFTLNPDARVDVRGSVRSQGRATVQGSVTLSPLTNPGLDLSVEVRNFRGVNRRDIEAEITGSVRVLQSYRRPRVEGRLTVDQGVLRVEELARAAEVVSLADMAFLDVMGQESTLNPSLRVRQNPFLQNLMLDVGLQMGRGSWLRGKDLDVEMGGDVQVFWDRTERDLALVGELQAIRGAYRFWNRQFQVEEGLVSFLGTPGVNPNLDIQAIHRLRTPEEQNLEITANLSGTLLAPRVALTSDAEFAIAESDLVSYLIFGRPSYALASGQNRALLGAAGGAGANFALGTISSQLGSVVANDFGLDFLAITQGDYFDPFGELGPAGTMASTQVEIGQYITDDVYAALLWRPLTGLAPTNQTQFAGLRVEWQVADLWTLEGYHEDRYSRSPVFRAGNLGYHLEKLTGFFFWREWGY